jgi:nitrite reductase/ring-hydroxylating ferredoxin subunit
MRATSPTRAAVYRRTVRAGVPRIWENVLDWEHLPWLHRTTFSDIKLLEEGREGWRARVGLQPTEKGAEIVVDVRLDRPGSRYVTRTVEGPGAGTEIWTTLEPIDEQTTRIEVEFRVPGLDPETARSVGEGYAALYARLWDEDEEMMLRRQSFLKQRRPRRRGAREPVDLGRLDDVKGRLPLVIDVGGRSFRVVEIDGDLISHSTVCPHLLGPLDNAPVEDGAVRCPWHGYRFDLRTGRSCDGRGLGMQPAPRVEIGRDSRVRLVWPEEGDG